jgi:hypothetical protein
MVRRNKTNYEKIESLDIPLVFKISKKTIKKINNHKFFKQKYIDTNPFLPLWDSVGISPFSCSRI